MLRLLATVALVACGQTTSDVDFECGDGGAICHSSSEYCEIVTAGSDVASDTGVASSTVAGCAPLVGNCTTCDCLEEAGVAACRGQQSCTSSGAALTFAQTCAQ